MKLTPWMLTVAAFLIVAVLAVGFVFKKLMAREVVVPPPAASRTLPMANTDIEPGTLVTRAHLATGPWSDKNLEPDTFLNIDTIVGRIAREKIESAKPLRGSQFYAPGERPDLDVKEGMRAVTVNVGDDTAMVNGLIRPGQYVDVHMTVEQSETNPRRIRELGQNAMTLLLFEGVRVVAINRSYTQSNVAPGNNVTLELDQKQAQIMLLASQKGEIALTFNPSGPGDGGVSIQSEQNRVTLQQVLGLPDPEEEKKPFMTEHYRGRGRGTHYYDEDGNRMDPSGRGVGGDTDGVPLTGNGDNWTSISEPEPAEPRKAAQTVTPSSL